jgi:murein lipoprotein
MKKSLLLVSMMFFPAVTLMSCATSGDLERMQAQQKLIDAKADQALKDAQAAKSAADAAK